MYQIMLRELIQKYEEKYRLYTFLGWNTDWLVKIRHLLLKGLLEDQLENFDK